MTAHRMWEEMQGVGGKLPETGTGCIADTILICLVSKEEILRTKGPSQGSLP